MEKVVTINLNGNPYSLEERGYDALRAYLESAQARLSDNPDRVEILADIEQAIADKCARFLNASKTVVTVAEIETILTQMGPVESADTAAGASTGSGPANENGRSSEQPKPGSQRRDPNAPRKLFQIREGAMVSGVCNGLATYINVDVTIVRVIFAGLTLATAGGFGAVYIVMTAIVPVAATPEDRAAAHGAPFNIQELIAQAKLNHQQFRARHEGKQKFRERAWRRQWRRMSRHGFAPGMPMPQPIGYAERATLGLSLPFIAMAASALFVVWVFALISLFTTHSFFGLPLPPQVPEWVWVISLIAIYGGASGPLRAASHSMRYHAGAQGMAPFAVLYGLVWAVSTALLFWLAYTNLPAAREMIHDMPPISEVWDQLVN